MDISLQVSAAGPTVTGAVLRSDQAYHELLCEKTTLDWGIAFVNARFAGIPAGNQFREVWVEDQAEVRAALDAVGAHFRDQQRACTRWVLAEAQNPEAVDGVLTEAGYRRVDRLAMALSAWPTVQASDAVRVLPARPMRGAFAAILEDAVADWPGGLRDDWVQAGLDRLDDHRMDMFVGLIDKKPAGACGLFQVGDIGRVVDPHVCSAFRRRGVATSMMLAAVGLARRLQMRIVCTDVSVDNHAGKALLSHLGFIEGGRIVEYVAPDAPATVDGYR